MTTETLSTRNEPERSVANDWQRYDQTALTPPVDVTEDAAGITLYADLPGVSRDKLQLQVETDTLTLYENYTNWNGRRIRVQLR